MSARLRMAAATATAIAAAVAADALFVDRGLDETVYGGGVIGVWAAIGLASTVALAYAAQWARRLQRGGDPYGDKNGDGDD